jgi:hypothetical protein
MCSGVSVPTMIKLEPAIYFPTKIIGIKVDTISG